MTSADRGGHVGEPAPEPWSPDWPAIAHRMVQSLQVQAGERVLFWGADPCLHPELLDELRLAVLTAGGIEHATVLSWSPRLAALRSAFGTNPDPDAAALEDQAQLDLWQTADIFIWLPNDFFRPAAYTMYQSEWVAGRWRGRGLHFHWFPDWTSPANTAVQVEIQKVYQRAILGLDYSAHADTQRRLLSALRGAIVRVTTVSGTDVSFAVAADGWYHLNDGDASAKKPRSDGCARDREEELPCGSVRVVPVTDSVEGRISYRNGEFVSSATVDLGDFTDHLDVTFRRGRIIEIASARDNERLQAAWAAQAGDKDRLGEVVFGTNPLLTPVAGARIPTYWGFGAGMFRFHLGDNTESGGSVRSTFAAELWLPDTTVEANGQLVIKDGQLLV